MGGSAGDNYTYYIYSVNTLDICIYIYIHISGDIWLWRESKSVYPRCCIRICSAMVGVPHRPLLLSLPTGGGVQQETLEGGSGYSVGPYGRQSRRALPITRTRTQLPAMTVIYQRCPMLKMRLRCVPCLVSPPLPRDRGGEGGRVLSVRHQGNVHPRSRLRACIRAITGVLRSQERAPHPRAAIGPWT